MGPPMIAQDTTWVTGPMQPDGYIDYVAASNEIRSQDIQPEDNAAINLLRAIGPRRDDDPFEAKWLILTGSESATSASEYPVPDSGFYVEPPEEIWDQLTEAECRAWTPDEYPGVSDWLDSNQAAMQLIRQAATRRCLWLPVIADQGTDPSLANSSWVSRKSL